MTKLNAPRKLALAFLVLLLVLLANAIAAWLSVRQLNAAMDWQRHTYQVESQLDVILSAMQDVETGARGYIITGDPVFLEPYQAAAPVVPKELDALDFLTRDNSNQKPRIEILRRQVQAKLAISKSDSHLRATAGLEPARRAVASRRGKAAMDAIRATIAAIRAEETGLLARREARLEKSRRTVDTSLILFALSSIGLLSLVFLGMAHALTEREKLTTALAELKRLEELRDSLTAMLVHDLRTPLTTLLGPLDMLASDSFGELDDAQREIVTISQQGGYRLLGLVNELLDISKMEAGQMQIRRDTVRVAVVVESALREVTRLDLGEAAAIRQDIAPDLPLMQADEDLLIRILINLLGNALKFTPTGGTITIAARRTEYAEADVVLISIRDTGEGIPRSQLKSIFDKFGQVQQRKAGRKMSTGLGLTFCKMAVEAHGGQIWAESEPGQGSVFNFTVPLRPWADSDASREAAEAAAALG